MAADTQRLLAKHFFASLFDFGFLSDAGAESFKKMLLGIAAVAGALGLLIVRVLALKYINLATHGTAADYFRETAVDHAFLMALPMWTVAFAIVLIGHALFPDELDYRILMAQPISRAAIFRAKLAAVRRFAALVIAFAHAALLLMVVVTTVLSLTSVTAAIHIVVFELVSLAASAFAALAIVAIHGVLILAAPRARLVTFSAIVRSGLICALVLVLPLLLRLPGRGHTVLREPWWLAWTPPLWFTGIERWMLGTGGPLPRLAPIALAATALAAVIAAGTYVILYRRFDRVILRRHDPQAPPRKTLRRFAIGNRHPVRRAVGTFIGVTLRRSVLHQGIVVALAAVAAGFIVNNLSVDTTPRRGYRVPTADEAAFWIATWAPFVFMFIAVPAIRLALSVPIELRANWVFRMTESDRTRGDAIGAAVQTMVLIGVLLPVAVALPFQIAVAGVLAAPIAAASALIGWLYVEILMDEWRRVPFTCSYLPGKGFLPQLVIKSVFGFIVFTGVGTLLCRVILTVPAAAVFAIVVVGVPAAGLTRRRRRTSRHAPLEFEDQLPGEISPLRLGGD